MSQPLEPGPAFEDRPEVREAIADDTTVAELPGAGGPEADGDGDPATPVFQEPGEPPHRG